MTVIGKAIVVGCALGMACGGCDGSRHEPHSTEDRGALAARSAACTLTLPFGSDASRFVVGANGSLQLGDRVVASQPIENMGAGGTQIGVDARVGDVYSASQIALRDRATVTGSVFTTVPLSTAPASRVLGPVNTHAVLTPAATQSIAANFPASGDVDVLLEPGQAAQPAPGRYRNVQVRSRATLSLRSGTYYFESLGVIEPQATVSLDERLGPVIIFVNQPLTFRGVVVSNLGQPDWLIAVIGGGTVTIESPFQGTILAPLAAMNLGTGGLSHTGAFYARDVLAQPGTHFTQHTSSALSHCSTVLGGQRARDLNAREIAVTFDPVTAVPVPSTFLHGVDSCLDTIAQPVGGPGPDGRQKFQLAANPGCGKPLLFCDAATGQVLSPQPTLTQLNAAPPPGSTCRAQASVDRCLCPVNPASLGAACAFSSDCPNGQVCATICAGPNCSVPRRCGTYEAGCDGLPELANCQDLEVCADPESVGSFTLPELQSRFKSPDAPPTPGNTPPPVPTQVDHFTGVETLLAAGRSGLPCGLEPARAGLPVVDQSGDNGAGEGKDNWGVRFVPTLSQQTASHTLEPFGVALPSFNASAGLAIVATVFGQDITVLNAQATLAAELCHTTATVKILVGAENAEAPADDLETGADAEKACQDAENFLERATTVMNWGEGQVLAAIDELQQRGPNAGLCGQMNREFPGLALDCAGAPAASAARIIDTLADQYHDTARDAIARANAYADRLAATAVAGGEHTFFNEPVEVMGAEASFPIGPFVVTIGGSVNATFKVTGTPRLDLETHPGRPVKIGAGFTITPSATVDATAFLGVGIAVVTIGIEGKVQLIGIDIPVTAEVAVQSQLGTDPRNPANDGYPFGSLAARAGGEFAALTPHRFGWDSSWSLHGEVDIRSFLSGELNGFVRIDFLFFSKTFRRHIVSWSGIDPEKFGIPPVIPLFALDGPLPFRGPPPVQTAPRFAYVDPPPGAQITLGTPPPPPPPPTDAGVDGGLNLPPQSPVGVKNLSGLTESTAVLCGEPPR